MTPVDQDRQDLAHEFAAVLSGDLFNVAEASFLVFLIPGFQLIVHLPSPLQKPGSPVNARHLPGHALFLALASLFCSRPV
ncbi:MAG TPA: hypothetical protein DEP84_09100 [Chloroflexi bacterium]|nr:hypothetical protein [Chloroflexota bacterium]